MRIAPLADEPRTTQSVVSRSHATMRYRGGCECDGKSIGLSGIIRQRPSSTIEGACADTRAGLRSITRQRETVEIDVRRAPRYEIREHASGARRHRPAERAVARAHIQIR